MSIGNLHPANAERLPRVALQAWAKNNGTIPVKFDNAVITIVDDPKGVANYILCDVTIGKREPWAPIGPGKIGVKLTGPDGLADFLNSHAGLAAAVFEVGQELTFGENTIFFYLDPAAPNEVQSGTLVFDFELNFKQYNQ